jgi:AraC-like DNA-binding protein
MKYMEFRPIPALADLIQVIWVMESEQSSDAYPRELIMPDGIVELVFHYGDPLYTWQDGIRFRQPRSFAVSMMRKCIAIESSGPPGILAVRFYPWGAYHFFTRPIASFLDQTIGTDQLWADHGDVTSDVLSMEGAERKVARVQQFLAAQLDRYKRDEPAVDAAVKLIRHSRGRLGIDDVCTRTGFSSKQLGRKLTGSVGVTPKIFSRVTRFLDICSRLDDQEHVTLSRLAHDCGFHDQAHFIKEFKAFSGFTPREFFTRRNVVFSDI